MAPVNTGEKLDKPGTFKPGEDPRRNDKGRPKGRRNALSEAFVEALHKDFKEHGVAAIQSCRTESAFQYLTVIGRVIPKDVNVNLGGIADLTDEQLDALDRVLDLIDTAGGADRALEALGGAGARATARSKQAEALRPVSKAN